MVQESGPVSLFQNLVLGKASTMDKYHLTIHLASTCQDQYIKIFYRVRDIGPVSLFRILTSAKSRPTIDGIWQSLGLDLVNISVYAKCLLTIPYGSIVRPSFMLSEFGPRQSFEQ